MYSQTSHLLLKGRKQRKRQKTYVVNVSPGGSEGVQASDQQLGKIRKFFESPLPASA